MLEIKSSISQIKNSVESLFSRLDQVKDKISDLDNKVVILECSNKEVQHSRPPSETPLKD
jgi:uncharacterized coiled-coil DUF342 family protein